MKEIIGTSNKLLEINLSTQTVEVSYISEADREQYLGGKGLGLKLLYDRLEPGIDPLGENNTIAFMMGVFMGSGAACTGRFDAVTKSPLTNIMVTSSCGGPFGMAYKTAGYDGLLITGKSDKPVQIVIDESGAKIEDASHLWGKDTQETQTELKLDKNQGAMVIGPAGENLVKFANVTSGSRYLGRGGIGAVMGSKKVKAIVATGKAFKIVPKNKELFEQTKKLGGKYIKKNNITSHLYKNYGTNGHVNLCNKANILPVNNFKDSSHESAYSVSGEMFKIKHKQKPSTCKPCSIVCGHKGEFEGGKIKKIPEYETTALFGPNLGIFDTEAIVAWNEECGLYGIDTISMGNIIGYLMEASEKDIIQTNLQFGKKEGISEIIKNTVYRKNLGKDIAEGLKSLSEKYGGKDFAIHVKGLEMSAYDPRGAWGQGLSYAVANRGACHLSAPLFTLEATLGYINPYTTLSKSTLVDYFEKMMSAINSLHTCQFTSFAYMLEPFVAKNTPNILLGKSIELIPNVALALMDISVYNKIFEAITGIKLSQAEMFVAGDRVHTLERYMNTREGISKKDDTLPSRMLNEGRLSDKKNHTVPLEKMLIKYYRIKGYDKNGVPTQLTLRKLGIV